MEEDGEKTEAEAGAAEGGRRGWAVAGGGI